MPDRTVTTRMVLDLARWTPAGEQAARTPDKIKDAAERAEKKHAQAWGKIGAASTVAAGAGVAALTALVGASMNFDKAMSGVAAVSNTSAAELHALREAALQAGADTSFSASEAATAEAELAKAGVATADILGGALTGSLGLAAAGQLDLAEAASISAQAMNIWGLSGKDVGTIADTLAAGANKSAADVADLGTAMRQAGLVAAQMGVGMQDTVGTLALFADNALVGSDAGTSLKTMLQRLAAPSNEAAGMMHRLGINAYDAGGNFIGMEKFAGILHSRLSGLTQEQRNMALSVIFGADAIRAASILYDAGATGVKDYTDAVDDQGAAGRMAAEQMNNLAGDVEALKGSLETALIGTGSQATGILRGLTQGATQAVNAFAAMPGGVQQATLGLVAAGTAGSLVLATMGTLVPKVREGREALRELGSAGENADRALGAVGRTATVATAVFVAWEAAGAAAEKVGRNFRDAAPDVDTLTTALRELAITQKAGGEASRLFGQNLSGVGQDIITALAPSTVQSVSDKLLDLGDNVLIVGKALGGERASEVDRARGNLEALDKALAGLVSSGNMAAAKDAFDQIAAAAAAKGVAVDDVRKMLPGYENELKKVGLASQEAANGTQQHGKAAQGTTTDLKDERTAAEKLAQAIDALSAKTNEAAVGDLDFRDSLDAVSKAIHDNGRTLDLNTQKGRDNRRAVIAARDAAEKHAIAVADQTDSVEAGRKTFENHISQLRRTLTQTGLTKGQVDALIRTYAKVPRKLQTEVTVRDRATSVIKGVTRELQKLPGSKTVTVTAIRVGSGGTAIEARQHGGPVRAHRAYEVGEHGRELFVPDTDGTIAPREAADRMFTAAAPAGAYTAAPAAAGVARVELLLASDGSRYGDFLMAEFRKAVKARHATSVQLAVMGRRE